MLTTPLALTLALAQSLPQAELRLEPGPVAEQVSLALCFAGQGQRIQYRLTVQGRGAGGNRSSQAGSLTATPEQRCPLRNRMSLPADGSIEAWLEWTVDGAEQPPIRRVYPAEQAEHQDGGPDRRG